MRLEALAYAENGQPVTVQFHPRLTVVGVAGAPARAEWIARVLGVLEGLRCGDGAGVVLVDNAGRPIRLQRDDQGAATLTNLATGADLPYAAGHLSLDGRFDWFASVGLTSRKAIGLMMVDAAAFTGGDEFDIADVEAQLHDAREQRAGVDSRRQASIAGEHHREELRRRIADLDEQIRRGAREPDAMLAAVRAAEEWSVAAGTVADTWGAFGRRPRLDREVQARALARPAEVPPDLETRAKTCRTAAERRDDLVARLRAGDAGAEEALRRELVDEVEPAYVDALAELAAACGPFGVVIDAARIGTAGIEASGIETLGTQVVAEVRAQAAEAGLARLQQALEDAESECHAAQQRVEACLAKAGFPSRGTGDLAARVEAAKARGALMEEQARLHQDLRLAEQDLAEATPPADEHAGLERRIAALEESLRTGCLPPCAEVKKVLLGRATQARRAGRAREPFPLLVNDVLAAFPASDKTALLDGLVRLGEKTQIVYLTDDSATLTWASGRVGTGDLALWPSGPPEHLDSEPPCEVVS
jgi:hypothetical protein